MNKQYKTNITQNHPFHLVDYSPWLLVAFLGALFITFGGVIYMHLYNSFLIYFFIIIHNMYYYIFRGLYFGLCIQSIEPLWISGVLLPILFFSDKRKINGFNGKSLRDFEKNDNSLTFKNKGFYFKKLRLPEILSLNNCKDIAESFQLLDAIAFDNYIKSKYSQDEYDYIFLFISILKNDGLLDDFMNFFGVKKKFHVEPYYIFEYTSPSFMRRLCRSLLIDFNSKDGITNNSFIKLKELFPFSEEQKDEFISAFLDNPTKAIKTITFWLF